jgi:hypothetical protein
MNHTRFLKSVGVVSVVVVTPVMAGVDAPVMLVQVVPL